MAVRFRKYFKQCKPIQCTGRRSRQCPDTPRRANGEFKTCGAWVVEMRDSSGMWVSRVFRDVTSKTVAKERLVLLEADKQRGFLNLPARQIIPDVGTFCKDYLKQIACIVKENTFRSRASSVSVITKYLGTYKIDRLTGFLIEKFMADRVNQGVLHTTINLNVCHLKEILNKAKQQGLIKANPCDDIAKLKGSCRKEKRGLTPEEIQLLLNELSGADRLMCVISLVSGLRLSDVLSLQWSNIDFNNSLISVVICKTGRPAVIPMPQNLHAELLLYKKSVQGAYLFNEGKLKYAVRVRFSNHFKNLFDKIGIKNASFHSLRHTAATTLSQLGNDISLTSRLLGHNSIQTTAGFYIHHDLGIKRAAVDMLERHILKPVEKPVEIHAISHAG